MKTNGVLLALAFAGVLMCQGPADSIGLPDLMVCADGRAPRTNEQWLACRGLQSTNDALLNALADPRPDVRSMAAQALAESGKRDAIPAIAAAFSYEKAPGTRMLMAYALAVLGDKQGLADLKGMCKSVGASATFRWSAAQYLRKLHDDSWIGGLIAVLQSEKQASLLLERGRNNLLDVGLLDLVTALPPDKASRSQLDEIRGLAADSLSAVSPDLRIAASQALAAFGDSASATRLDAAIAREKDQEVLSHMKGDLEKLRLSAH